MVDTGQRGIYNQINMFLDDAYLLLYVSVCSVFRIFTGSDRQFFQLTFFLP